MAISGNFTKEDNSIVITVRGRFDYSCHREFRGSFEELDAKSKLTIDLSHCEYMDSSALGMLLVLREQAGGDSSSVTIRGATGAIKQVLEIAHFQDLFRII